MTIGIIGLNHHQADVALRERVAVSSDEKSRFSAALVDKGPADEAVVVSTCNRTELVLRSDDPDAAAEAGRNMLLHRASDKRAQAEEIIFELRNIEAVTHLFEVVTSLDSLVIGEPHIIGQIREDFERARKAGAVGKVLGRLFYRAIQLAKCVRRGTSLGDSSVSVSSIALDLAAKVFGNISGRPILVLGAGEMGRQTGILAANRGGRITVTSRTEANAKKISDRVGGTTVPWSMHVKAMAEADIIITSTSASAPIIDRAEMTNVMQARRKRPVFIIDIALPRDVSPAVDSLYNVYRYDLDDLTQLARENEARRQNAIPAVRQMIEEAVIQFDRWRTERKVVPAIVTFRDKVEQIRKSELEAHLRRMHSLDDRDRNLVEALTVAIANKVLHTPTIRLKDAAAEGTDQRHAGALAYLFDLDLEEEFGDDDE
jgi:glutamyl-tRNA reductase